jgi:hypothetical protein
MSKKSLLLLVAVLFAGCSSGPRVLERADGLWSRPDWVQVTRPSFDDDGKRYFVGYVEVDGDASKSAALNMSDEKALSEPMRALVDQFLDQNQVGEDVRHDAAIGQRIISATRGYRPPMPTLTIVKRYWETVATGETTSQTRAFSLAEISIPEFDRTKREVFLKLTGNTQLKAVLDDVGKKQRENVLGESVRLD